MNTFKNLGRNFSLIFSFTLLLGLLASCEQESKSEFLPIAITAPQAGEYTSSSLEITLVTTTKSSSIRYTLDGVTEPGKDQGTLYVAPIVINKSTTLKHIVIGRSGKTSRVVTSVYTLNSSSLSVTNTLCIGAGVPCTKTSTSNLASAAAGSVSVDLRSNTTWTVTSSNTAMCPKPADGSNNQSVNITVTANTGAVARTCTVTFSATGVADVVVTINQVAPGGAVPANTLCIGAGVPCTKTSTSNLASAAGSVSVDLRSNTTWTVQSSNTAMCPKPADGSNNQSVNITVTANTGAVARTCTVTFSATGVADVVVTINQVAPGGAVPANTLCIGAGLPCTKTSTSNLASAAGSVSVDLRSNTTWTVTSSNMAMCPKPADGNNNQSVNVTVNANTGAVARTCTITFSATGVADVVVTINQVAPGGAVPANSLCIGAGVPCTKTSTSNLASAAGSVSVDLRSNTTWTVTSSNMAMCPKPANGSNNQSVNVTVNANTGAVARTCIITFSATGVTNVVVTINQAAPVAVVNTLCIGAGLPCTKTSTSNLASAAGSVSVDLRSNTTWTVTSSNMAMCPKPANGSNNQSVNVTVNANTGAVARTCIITFSATGVTNVVVTINQAAPVAVANTLCIGGACTKTSTYNVTSAGMSVSIDLRSNTNWTVASSNTAMCPKPADGSNNKSVAISVSENTGVAARTCTVTFSATGVLEDVVVTITQASDPGAAPINSLCIGNACTTSSTHNVTSAGMSVSIDLRSNTNWTVQSSNTAMCPKPADGSNNQSVAISVSENTGVAARTCTITFSATGVANVVVTIEQAGVVNNLCIGAGVPCTITSTSNVVAAAGSVSVDLRSNTNWTVASSNTAMCPKPADGSNNQSVAISVSENTGVAARTCTITFSATGVADVVVTINQVAPVAVANTLCIGDDCETSATHDIAHADATGIWIDVSSNTTWTVTNNNNAMCTTVAGGNNDDRVFVNVNANTGAVARTCTITFSATGVTDVVVTINQPGIINSLCIGDDCETSITRSNITAEGDTISVDIRSNTNWTVQSSDTNICFINSTTGNRDNNFNIFVTSNSAVNAAQRSCTVTFSATGTENVVVTIRQRQSPFFHRLQVTNNLSEVSSQASTLALTVVSNVDWELTNATAGNCTISETSGDGIVELELSILNNTSNADRECRITSNRGTNIRITQRHPLTITSANFTHNDTLHSDFTANAGGFGSCTGKNDFPQLSWNKTLSTIQSFVLIVDDPDGLNWVHLNLYNIPSTTTSIARLTANASHEVTFPNGQVGQNDFNGHPSIPGTGWGGPCPPNGTHNYNFKIYAMSVPTLGSALDRETRATFEATYGPEGNNQILDSAVIIGRVAK